MSVAGKDWIDAMQKLLEDFGLRATKRPQKGVFRGIGGARCESKYTYGFPVGVMGNNTSAEIAATD
eukprot:12886786-Prorocentrum_lima.AAC.1